jgi:hypothetical protein
MRTGTATSQPATFNAAQIFSFEPNRLPLGRIPSRSLWQTLPTDHKANGGWPSLANTSLGRTMREDLAPKVPRPGENERAGREAAGRLLESKPC